MIGYLSDLAADNNTPFLAAFAMGLLAAIAPCPLATNISATAYITKTFTYKRDTLIGGIFYTLGRMLTYFTLGLVLSLGVSKFELSRLFLGRMEKYLGYLLILIGLIMLDVIKLNFLKNSKYIDYVSNAFKNKGFLSSFLLGATFALAFCPYSGALFFALLIPMMFASESGLGLPVLFALGTGIPVIFFAYIFAFSAEKLGEYFKIVSKVEKCLRIVTGLIFLVSGFYYINIFLKKN